MKGVAIDMDLPVRAGRCQLFFQSHDGVNLRHGVIVAVQDQHLGLDVGPRHPVRRAQEAMETDHPL